MGDTKNPHFYDFGSFERAPEPQNQLFLSLETPRDLKPSKNIPKSFLGIRVLYFIISEIQHFEKS